MGSVPWHCVLSTHIGKVWYGVPPPLFLRTYLAVGDLVGLNPDCCWLLTSSQTVEGLCLNTAERARHQPQRWESLIHHQFTKWRHRNNGTEKDLASSHSLLFTHTLMSIIIVLWLYWKSKVLITPRSGAGYLRRRGSHGNGCLHCAVTRCG